MKVKGLLLLAVQFALQWRTAQGYSSFLTEIRILIISHDYMHMQQTHEVSCV
jgi:hypothetical protein